MAISTQDLLLEALSDLIRDEAASTRDHWLTLEAYQSMLLRRFDFGDQSVSFTLSQLSKAITKSSNSLEKIKLYKHAVARRIPTDSSKSVRERKTFVLASAGGEPVVDDANIDWWHPKFEHSEEIVADKGGAIASYEERAKSGSLGQVDEWIATLAALKPKPAPC